MESLGNNFFLALFMEFKGIIVLMRPLFVLLLMLFVLLTQRVVYAAAVSPKT